MYELPFALETLVAIFYNEYNEWFAKPYPQKYFGQRELWHNYETMNATFYVPLSGTFVL